MRICVYGASSTELDRKYIDATYELGRDIARRGHGLVYGGGAQGVMGATARGVRDGGGEIIGVTPEFFNVDGVVFEDCTQLIFTKTMRERKQTMEDHADAFIVAPGGFGTYEEFFEILTLKQLERHNKAIAIFNVDGCYDMLFDFIARAMSENFIKEACKKLYQIFDNKDQMLDYLENYVPEKIGIKKLRDVDESYTYDNYKTE